MAMFPGLQLRLSVLLDFMVQLAYRIAQNLLAISAERTSKSVTHFRIPDLLPGADWPFSCPTNPLSASATTESLGWIRNFYIYGDEVSDALSRYRIDVLVAWSYRHASPEHYRLCSNLLHVYWIIDDLTDKQTSAEVQREVEAIMFALRDPYGQPPVNETALGKILKSFWRSTINDLNPPASMKARFLVNFEDYLRSLSEEAGDRESGHLRGFEEYLHLRRRTAGILPSFDFLIIPFDLPEVIMNHPHIERMTVRAGDLVIIANAKLPAYEWSIKTNDYVQDVYSWNVEQSQAKMRAAAAHNIVGVVMREMGFGVQEAMDYVGRMYRPILDGLIEDFRTLPLFTPSVDTVVRSYAEGLLEWVEGNVEYSLASGRYFGDLAGSPEIRKGGTVEMLPPRM